MKEQEERSRKKRENERKMTEEKRIRFLEQQNFQVKCSFTIFCVYRVRSSLANLVRGFSELPCAWSSLVEGDEQLDRPNSQTFMELCLACAALFLGV